MQSCEIFEPSCGLLGNLPTPTGRYLRLSTMVHVDERPSQVILVTSPTLEPHDYQDGEDLKELTASSCGLFSIKTFERGVIRSLDRSVTTGMARKKIQNR